ncbi:MAG: transcriptional regulator [Gammaproteobacteria bacterium RIFCSPHIGHO2_12_FULL_37_14]|nr:MAG: transcriptional regulator [Gammaproteobacteria bacterium RIFCSPHIGHO2_12_FULL_37_14]
MTKKNPPLLPSLARILKVVGAQIRLARLRRRFSTAMISKRAGISRNTLRSIERGKPTVSFGAYAMVLLTLNLEDDLFMIAKDDVLGRKLQDAGLPTKMRAPK